jgi:hypothetical protein
MAVLVTAIHDFLPRKAWMRGSSPRMTTVLWVISVHIMQARLTSASVAPPWTLPNL